MPIKKLVLSFFACLFVCMNCFAEGIKGDEDAKNKEILKKFYEDEIVKFNPDKYPSIGISAGTDIYNSPLNYQSDSFLLDTRYPLSPYSTFWAEGGVLKVKDNKNGDVNGKRLRGGLRFYFHQPP